MTKAKDDTIAPQTPAPVPEEEFDMTSVKEASSFSNLGLMIGGGLLVLMFLISLRNSPSKEPSAADQTDVPALPAAEVGAVSDAAAAAGDAAAAAVDAAAAANATSDATVDAAPPAPVTSVEFPELADACNAADTPAAGDQCSQLGNKYEKGVEVKKDASLAADIYDVGCNKGSMMACANAGVMYGDPNGNQQRPEVSFRLLKRACDSELMYGCAELGYNYQYGVGVAQDKGRARELYSLACSGGWNKGCEYLSSLEQTAK